MFKGISKMEQGDHAVLIILRGGFSVSEVAHKAGASRQGLSV